MSWLEWKGIIAIQLVVSRGLAGERRKRVLTRKHKLLSGTVVLRSRVPSISPLPGLAFWNEGYLKIR